MKRRVRVERGAFAGLVIAADVALHGPLPVALPSTELVIPPGWRRSRPTTRLRRRLDSLLPGEEALISVGAERTYKAKTARRYPQFEWRHVRMTADTHGRNGSWMVYARRPEATA